MRDRVVSHADGEIDLECGDADGIPAHLEATSPDNGRLYERHAFDVIGEVTLPDGSSLWPMWRNPQPQ